MIADPNWLWSVLAMSSVVVVAVMYVGRVRSKLSPTARSMQDKCWCCYNRTSTSHNKRTVSRELVKSFACTANDDNDDDIDSNDSENEPLVQIYSTTPTPPTKGATKRAHYHSRQNSLIHEKKCRYPMSRYTPVDDPRYDGPLYGVHTPCECHSMEDDVRYDARFSPSDTHYSNDVGCTPTNLEPEVMMKRTCTVMPPTHHLFEAKRKLFRRQTSVSTEDGSQESYSNDIAPIHHSRTSHQNTLKQRAIFASAAFKCSNRQVDKPKYGSQLESKGSIDLISLAEKGRIGKQTSMEENSSETGSAVDPILTSVFRKKLSNRMLLRMNPNSSESSNSLKDDDRPKFGRMQSFGSNDCESDSQLSTQLPDFPVSNKRVSAPVPVTAVAVLPRQGVTPKVKALGVATVTSTTKPTTNKPSSGALSGKLEISFAYDAPSKRLCVGVMQLTHSGQNTKARLCDVAQVHVQVTLLPTKRHKHKTKCKPIFCPIFMESFTFGRISVSEIARSGIRLRVFSQSAFSRKVVLVGECELLFSQCRPQQQETRTWIELGPPKLIKRQLSDDRSEASSLEQTESTSSQSLYATLPEILLGLSYNATTGRLSVTIIKGSQLRNTSGGGPGSGKAPDTYVKVSLLSSNGQEIARSKTSVCRGQPNPYFKETFMFQVPLFQLPDVTLMLLTYCRRNIKRKDLIGWVSFGYNSSGDEQSAHWNDMRDNRGEQVSRWHILQQS